MSFLHIPLTAITISIFSKIDRLFTFFLYEMLIFFLNDVDIQLFLRFKTVPENIIQTFLKILLGSLYIFKYRYKHLHIEFQKEFAKNI